MKTRVVIVTLLFGIPAFLLSRVIWPISPDISAPTEAQLPLLLALAVIEALAFGLGAAFILIGFPLVRKAARVAGVAAWPVYLSIAWQLVSWWPHDNFHQANGMNIDGLIAIEYGFHVTLIATGLVVARFFLATLRHASLESAGDEVASRRRTRAA